VRENKRGITLIALVITIIILLILAGIGVATLTAENGLLNKTNESAFITEMKGYQEATRIYVMEQEIRENGMEEIKISVGLERTKRN